MTLVAARETSSMGGEITALLGRVKAGDRSALDELVPLVYNELHKVADHYLRRERPNHTLAADRPDQ